MKLYHGSKDYYPQLLPSQDTGNIRLSEENRFGFRDVLFFFDNMEDAISYAGKGGYIYEVESFDAKHYATVMKSLRPKKHIKDSIWISKDFDILSVWKIEERRNDLRFIEVDYRNHRLYNPMRRNPDKIDQRLAMIQKDLSEQEAKYYELKERLDTLRSEYRQLLNIYHNLDEPDDYLEDELQEYDHIIPALQSELDELKEELEHYNVKLKRNPRRKNPINITWNKDDTDAWFGKDADGGRYMIQKISKTVYWSYVWIPEMSDWWQCGKSHRSLKRAKLACITPQQNPRNNPVGTGTLLALGIGYYLGKK